jgi:tetratricopeptide (TPR) repeat protein
MSYQSKMLDIQEARAAAEANQGNPWLWSNLGDYLMEAKQNREALAEFEKAHRLAPDDPAFLNNMGDCHIALGEYARAVEVLGQAIALRPDWARPYYHRARAHRAAGNLEAAISDANTALEKEAARGQPDKKARLQYWLLLQEIDPDQADPEISIPTPPAP